MSVPDAFCEDLVSDDFAIEGCFHDHNQGLHRQPLEVWVSGQPMI